MSSVRQYVKYAMLFYASSCCAQRAGLKAAIISRKLRLDRFCGIGQTAVHGGDKDVNFS